MRAERRHWLALEAERWHAEDEAARLAQGPYAGHSPNGRDAPQIAARFTSGRDTSSPNPIQADKGEKS